MGSAVAGPPQALPADLSQQLGHDLDLLAAAEHMFGAFFFLIHARH